MSHPEPSVTLLLTEAEQVVTAVRRLRSAGLAVREVYSPFPIHGLDDALELRETRIGWATLVGGLTGGTLALGFMAWTHAIDWPRNFGGKTLWALPALVPVTFELTVLLAGLATFWALLWRTARSPGREAIPPPQDPRVSDDRFAVLLDPVDPERVRPLAGALGAHLLIDGEGGHER